MRMATPPRVRRVSGPGARAASRPRAWLGVAGAIGAALAVSAGIYLALPGGQPASARYGGLPSWLPTQSLPVGRVVQASAAHPWLAIEGDTVQVRLAAGQVLATAVGPEVPEEGQFPVPATTPCTFTITFTRAYGTVPLSQAAFTIIDEQGHLHRPHVTEQGGGSLPGVVKPGQTVTLIVAGVLPTGAGQLRWTPQGTKPIVSWDFDVEID